MNHQLLSWWSMFIGNLRVTNSSPALGTGINGPLYCYLGTIGRNISQNYIVSKITNNIMSKMRII